MSDNYPAGVTPFPGRDDRLDVRLTQRYSAAESVEITARGRALGVKPGAWIRAVVRDALDARRAEVVKLHRSASQRPDPERAAAIAQLRGVGVMLNQEQRRRNGGYKALEAIGTALDQSGALDDDLRADIIAAARALADPAQARQLAAAIAAVDDLRAAFGDRTRL